MEEFIDKNIENNQCFMILRNATINHAFNKHNLNIKN